MRELKILLFIFILDSCGIHFAFITKRHGVDDCYLINKILETRSVSKILKLESAKKNYPYIRVMDLTKQFDSCSRNIFKNSSNVFIGLEIVNELRKDMNTGWFRDLVIYDYSAKKDYLNISLTAPIFERNSEPCIARTNYAIDLKFRIISDSLVLLEESAIEWSSDQFNWNYDDY